MIKRFLVSLIVLIVALGLSRAHIKGGYLPDLIVITIWMMSWLTNPYTSITTAAILGVLLDLVLFMPIGFWTISLVTMSLAIILLKIRILESSNIFHALFTLLISCSIMVLALLVIGGRFTWVDLSRYYLTNLITGGILFYILGLRFSLFQHWQGKLVRR